MPFHVAVVFRPGFVQIVLIILCGRPFLRHLCVGSSNSHSVSWQADVDSVQSIVGRHQREKLKKSWNRSLYSMKFLTTSTNTK